ncbi:hypothetical protein DFP73DRAFT_614247 [Morchella snyderi]|nr:hypothetical protein DFP73DRAFT_614247 [Morchella snyderi]
MVVPWRFRSDECKFSEEDWECLRATIIRSLHINSVGLEGPLAHGTEWDDWFENLLYVGGIGEKYWGEPRGREWIFPRDRTAIQTVLRAQIVEMAGVERSKLKVGKTSETPNPGDGTVNPPAGAILENEPKGCGVAASSNSAIVDPQRRGPGRPKKKSQTPGARTKKHVAIEENSLNPVKRSRVSKGEGTEIAKASENISNSTSDNNTNHNDAFLALRSPAITQTPISGNPGLVFETRLANSQKAKFIYANDTPSLSLFFGKVREKFQLKKEQRIDSIEVEIGTKVFVVDLDEERDWISVIGVAEKTCNTGVGVVVGVV